MDWNRRLKEKLRNWWFAILAVVSIAWGIALRASALMGLYMLPKDFTEQFGVPAMSPNLFIGAGFVVLILIAWAWLPEKKASTEPDDLAEISFAHERWQGALDSIDYLRNMLPAKSAGLLGASEKEKIKIAKRKLEELGLAPPPDTPEWKWPDHMERLYPHVEQNGIEEAKKERDSWYV